MKLSFDDTQRAFAHKSNFDLQKAYRLFQTLIREAPDKFKSLEV